MLDLLDIDSLDLLGHPFVDGALIGLIELLVRVVCVNQRCVPRKLRVGRVRALYVSLSNICWRFLARICKGFYQASVIVDLWRDRDDSGR